MKETKDFNFVPPINKIILRSVLCRGDVHDATKWWIETVFFVVFIFPSNVLGLK